MLSQLSVRLRTRTRTTTVAGAVIAALVLGSAAPIHAQPPLDLPLGESTPLDPAARSLTLVTGDRVTVIGDDQVQVQPRAGVHFLQHHRDGELYLLPTDALPMIAADRLDDQLFNLTRQLEYGLDQGSELPLLVTDAATVPGITSADTLALPVIDGFATQVPHDELAEFWAANQRPEAAGKIWLDGVNQPALDVSVPLTGAPAAWAEGLDGDGVRVAVLDTGIDDSHPDLIGQVVARANFIDGEPAADIIGHGTHVASTVGGSGAGAGGRLRGVAPGVELLDAKVCGLAVSCPDSALLAGMQWAVDSGADVINLSLGAPDTPGVDPLERAVNALTAEHGVLFVAAAGNHHPWFGAAGVNTPSTAEAALSVANATKGDRTGLVPSSEFGPRRGDYGVKPEVAAPGDRIVAAYSKDTVVEYDPADIVRLPGGDYLTATGTSMATPHVAGLAALLLQRHPDWSPEQVKAALVGSAAPMPGVDLFGQGAGHVDLARAMAQPVTASPPVLNVGVLEYPHVAVTEQEVRYRNHGDAPVTLTLALDTDAPAGLIELTEDTTTVPAGGSATVSLSIDPRIGGDSYEGYRGRLVAVAEGVEVQTPVSLLREEPAAGLRLRAVDRSGGAPESVYIGIQSLTDTRGWWVISSDESLRLPPDDYSVTGLVTGADGSTALFVHPRLSLTEDRELVLDARQARPIEVSVPNPSAAPVSGTVYLLNDEGPHPRTEAVTGDPRMIYTADLSGGQPADLATQVQVVLAEPDGAGEFTDSPYAYHLGWNVTGAAITGLERAVAQADLATVRAEYAENIPGALAYRWNTVELRDGYQMGLGLPPVRRPATRTEYLGGDAPWLGSTVLEASVEGRSLTMFAKSDLPYRPGEVHTERWGGAVYGFTMVPQYPGSAVAVRDGDTIRTMIAGTSDAAGNVGTIYDSSGWRQWLYRDDQVVGEADFVYGQFDVDAGPAEYRWRTRVDHVDSRFSTRLDSEWTFSSGDDRQGLLPLTAIGFAPELALDNTARVRRTLPVPLTFTQQEGAGEVVTVTVSASYDDGVTWTDVPVVGGDRVALVKHPATPGFVSLRGNAVDADGNTVTMTIIRAYEIR